MVESDREVTRDVVRYDFNKGQCMHFSMKLEELDERMRRGYMKIGVFRENESFPMISTSLKLSGCVCDLISKAVSESRPFVFKGPFDLVDSGNTPAGRIHLDLHLTSLGRYSITQYALGADHFLVKKERCGAEYMCCELKGRGERERSPPGPPVDGDIEDFMRDIAGISPLAARLARGKPPKSTKLREELTEEIKKPASKKRKKKKKKKGKKKK